MPSDFEADCFKEIISSPAHAILNSKKFHSKKFHCPVSQASKGKARSAAEVRSAVLHTVPFDGHQLPRFIALAHQHAPIRAVPQLSHGRVPVHLGKIMQQKLLTAVASLQCNINVNSPFLKSLFLPLDCCGYTAGRFVIIIQLRLLPKTMKVHELQQ